MARRWMRLVPLVTAMVAVAGPMAAPARAATASDHAVIVRASTTGAAASAVRRAGGTVGSELNLINGVAAHVSDAGWARLASAPGIGIAVDATLRPTGDKYGDDAVPVQVAALDPAPSSPADAGAGVAVALIDTGVMESKALHGRLVKGPDLSGEEDGIDHYGHGTFMAGLIAGDGSEPGSSQYSLGVAPGATIVSVKVAGADGSTSLSKVINGIGWAVTHRDQFHIKVINLSFGVGALMPADVNPLDAAVEAAWASNITVVTAAGNRGEEGVTSPGDDPYAITVGAVDTRGTAGTGDDTRPAWSAESTYAGYSKPELVAPGVSVVSLRAHGSTIDRAHPDARIEGKYFRGTGTSMSTALTAGAALIVAWHHPAANPDDIKSALVRTSKPVAGSVGRMVDLAAADTAPASPSAWQHYPLSLGGAFFGDNLTGMPWTAGSWTAGSWTAGSWTAGSWTAGSWTAGSWTAGSWTAGSWTAGSWTAGSWTAGSWTAEAWA